ncbi:MAG: endonuclease/exonuclease/phosphatase family protein, partial [Planctomycetaceae bacterium]
MLHQSRLNRLSAQSLCLGLCLLVVSLLSSLRAASADEPPRTLRLVTHNVYYGFTKRGDPRYGAWKRWMAAQAPDIVSLQELNGYTQEKLSSDA